MVAEIERGCVDPQRPAQPTSRHGEQLPEPGHQMQPGLDRLQYFLDPDATVRFEQVAAVQHGQRPDVLRPELVGPQQELVFRAQPLHRLHPSSQHRLAPARGLGTFGLPVRAGGLVRCRPDRSNVGCGSRPFWGNGCRPGEGGVMPEVDELELESRVEEILNRRPVVGLAVGVVRNGRLEFFHGHGLADIASNTPITEDTVFRIGSITKTVTAIAVMQLCEHGLVNLDTLAENYLRAYTLVPAKDNHPPATVRHLLTHTSGIPELVYPSRAYKPILGETVAFGRRVPTLAEFYRGCLRQVAEPGTRQTYSSHNFATLGQIVEDVSGTPLNRYVRENIFAPLGMPDTDLVRSDRVRARLATGYALRSDGPRPVGDCDLVTVGAGAVYSATRDMARYVAALLGGGANDLGSVLKPATLASMFAPHYRPDPRLPGAGLAFFRHDLHGHLVVDHDGLMPGFCSQMSLAPDDGVGVVAFTNGARGAMAWLGAEISGLLRYVLGVGDDAIRTDVAHHPEVWRDICGWYSLRGSWRDVQKWFIAGAEVFVNRGRLMIRPFTPVPSLLRGLPLRPDDDSDPYVFRVDLSDVGIGTSRVVFSREPGAEATSLHLDFPPLSFDRQRAISNPRPWGTAALAAVAVATTARAVGRRRRLNKGAPT